MEFDFVDSAVYDIVELPTEADGDAPQAEGDTPGDAAQPPEQDAPGNPDDAAQPAEDGDPKDAQKPSPLGVGAPGEQSGGLFSATTGRQAPGTVAQPKAETDEVPADAAQSGDAVDDAGNVIDESSAAPTTGEAQSVAEGDLISQRETLTEGASQPDLAENSPQESFPGAAVSPEEKPFGDAAPTNNASMDDSSSTATDDAESASDPAKTPAATIYGVPAAEPESPDED